MGVGRRVVRVGAAVALVAATVVVGGGPSGGGQVQTSQQVVSSPGTQSFTVPADVCQVGDAFCPTTEASRPRFEILSDFHHPILDRVPQLLEEHGVHVAALELITDRQGEVYAYDLNTNTNYNSQAEAKTRFSGMGTLARYLGDELEMQTGRPYQPDLAQIA